MQLAITGYSGPTPLVPAFGMSYPCHLPTLHAGAIEEIQRHVASTVAAVLLTIVTGCRRWRRAGRAGLGGP
jgi:hypothetical protein